VTTLEGRLVTDASYVERLRAGDREALASLFDAYADRVYNHCFRRTASWDLAEDATSTVFLEAWRGRSRVQVHEGSALPWLLGIATNVCRNLTRSSRRQLRLVSRVGVFDEVDHADGVADAVDSERRMAAVLAAVRELPRHEQEVLALVVWAGLSYDAAAVSLGVPIGTVRSRLSRARTRLATIEARTS
jgi:RNA polymerase sigma factor (sigma-70 family)